MSEEEAESTVIDDQVLKRFEDAAPQKRGRGRPRKNPPENESPEDSVEKPVDSGAEDEDTESSRGADDDEEEGKKTEMDYAQGAEEIRSDRADTFYGHPGSSGHQDFALIAQGIQIIGEIVRSQTETQERLMQSQREFSNSVMDRMESYRQEISKVQNESAEKEKSRLQQDYLRMSEKADEYSDENSQLKIQLEAAGRKIVKLNSRIESLEMQKTSLEEKLTASEATLEDVRKRLVSAKATLEENTVLIRKIRDYAAGTSTGITADGMKEEHSNEDTADGGTSGGGQEQGCPHSGPAASKTGGAGSDNGENQKKTLAHSSWRESRRIRKIQKKRDRIVMDACSDSRFSSEQIAVVRDAAKEGLPPEKLLEFCRPEIPAENMKAMLAYIRKR